MSSLVVYMPWIFLAVIVVFPIFGIYLIISSLRKAKKDGTAIKKGRIVFAFFLIVFGICWIFAPMSH